MMGRLKVLATLRQLTTREIAELYGWKTRNCEHVLSRARKALMKSMRQEGYDL